MTVDLEKLKKPCACGKAHTVSVQGIWIEDSALERIPQLFAQPDFKPYKVPVMVCDENTWEAAGRRVKELLPQCGVVRLSPVNLHADEIAVDKVLSQLDDRTDILLAVGSGTIHDTTRYVAYQKGIPFLSVPTAASVDGFVSSVAAMTWYGFKKTLTAVAPLYVFADTEIISKAPFRLTASGISDLLGKYTAIADWRIAQLVTGEYLCETLCQMEADALIEVENSLDGILRQDSESCGQLMYALLLSGLAMQMAGNSRPASGSEHHMSHFWEMEVLNPKLDAYHGEKVSVGLLEVLKVYARVRESIEAGTCSVKPDYSGLDTERIGQVYAKESLYKDILQENTPDPMAAIEARTLEEKLPEIAKILRTLLSPARMEALIRRANGKCTPEDIGLLPELVGKSLEFSPFVRSRLTFMRLIQRLELPFDVFA